AQSFPPILYSLYHLLKRLQKSKQLLRETWGIAQSFRDRKRIFPLRRSMTSRDGKNVPGIRRFLFPFFSVLSGILRGTSVADCSREISPPGRVLPQDEMKERPRLRRQLYEDEERKNTISDSTGSASFLRDRSAG